MASPPSIHKTVKVHRPRSSQQVSISWDEADDADASGAARLQFEVAECVETKTITTTTTTKRSYPPMFVRDPRPLHLLDTKEYPLASRATPPELSRFTVDLTGDEQITWASDEPVSQTPSEQLASDISRIPASHKDYISPKPESPVDSLVDLPTTRQTARSALQNRSRKLKGLTTSLQKRSRSGHSSAPNNVSDKLRRAVANGARRENEKSASRGPAPTYPATPDASEMNLGFPDQARLRAQADEDGSPETRTTQVSSTSDVPSRGGHDGLAMFSGAVATPPITDADVEPFANLDESLQESVRALHHPRPTINTVAAQDASLPSPRLSPTLQAAQLHMQAQEGLADEEQDSVLSRALSRRDRSYFMDESQTTEEGDSALTEMSPTPFSRRLDLASPQSQSTIFDSRSMLESFDAMPNEMKTFMMYQFLRRCSRKTLRMVSDVVNPALKCDFLRQLPLELSLHVLSYLNHTDLCRVAQVSKHWRNIADSNETGWKELFDRDGFELSQTELERAVTQGWGWQDPVGVDGCEVDLSMQTRLTSTDMELFRVPPKTETTGKLRSSKRKRSLATQPSDRTNVKRRARLQDMQKDDKPESINLYHKSKGPLSAANAAALAVPNPQIGLPSLRRLHLFKSLYRRHHMIRQSWTSGKVKPGHVAFAAHPRHVITCLQFDDDKIITGSDDTLIHIYDTKTGELRKVLEGHEGGVWALQYQGNILVSGSTDRTVRVWDIEKGLCNQMFFGHTSTVRCLQILMPTETGRFQDGRPVMMPTKPLIITGSRDSQLRVWRLPEAGSRRYIQTGPPPREEDCPFYIRILAGHTHSVRAISAHGDILVSGSYDSTVRVWRISTGEALHVLSGHNQKVYSVVLDHQRNRCISGSMDSLVKIWDLDTGACLHTLGGHSLLVGLLDLRDERLVSAAADSTLRIWDPETGKCKSTLMAHTGAITCFQHDGRKVISGSEKTVKMWDIHTGECIQDLLTDLSGVWQVKFDGRRCVAAVQRDNLTYVEILDFGAIRDGKPPEELGKRILLNGPAVQALIEEEV